MKKVYLGLWLGIILLANGVKAQTPVTSAVTSQKLWQIDPSFQLKGFTATDGPLDTLRHQGQIVRYNRQQLKGLQVGQTVTLPLFLTTAFDDPSDPSNTSAVNSSMTKSLTVDAQITQRISHANNSTSFIGQIIGSGQSYSMILTVSEFSVFATISTSQGVFNLDGRGDGGYLQTQQVLDQVIDHQKIDYLLPPSSKTDPAKLSPASNIVDSPSMDSTLVNVEVLVVYTPGADALYNNDAPTRINHLFTVTNQIYVDSGVFIQITPLAMDRANYSDTVDSGTALTAILLGSDASLANVASRRASLGADMVVFMRPYAGDGICGIAYVNGSNGSVSGYENYMYSHTSINCSDYVNAHELGHNMGLNHSRRQSGVGATFPFALGYGVDGEFVTVMAYPSAFNNATTINKFSNVNLDCNGQPCGIDQANSATGADAVFALNEIRQGLANLFQSTLDSDNDGVNDSDDAFPNDPTETVDTDGDGIGNNADPDDDNDGVLDSNDAFPLDASESVDTDGDGVGNNADSDDDNDGVLDSNDAFPLDASESVDTDGDGIGNNADSDDDNDGVLDSNDAFPLDTSESADTDGDGIGNNADSDDDNDGVSDSNDAFPLDASESVDTDGDGIGNNADSDDDNDGVSDSNDAFPLDASESVDSDGDGIGNNADSDDDNDGVSDSNDAFPLDASESVDTDGDGVGNNADSDDDNDGVSDSNDAFPLDASESADTDGDGIGNNADSDDDNDGVSDSNDAFPLDASESVDTDGDGVGNNADSDDDNDGVLDSNDAFPLDASESVDSDGDGIGNNADSDDDNDGVSDSNDAFPLDASESADTDGDGIGNNADSDDDNDSFSDSDEIALGTDPLDVNSFPVQMPWLPLLLNQSAPTPAKPVEPSMTDGESYGPPIDIEH